MTVFPYLAFIPYLALGILFIWWDGRHHNKLLNRLRNAALEDAAQIADAEASIEGIAQRIADKIRALKTKERGDG